MRILCRQCLQPSFSCYCQWLKPFDPGIRFLILIHPIEQRRRIATGRMSHLSLKNSELIVGHDFTRNARLNRILEEPRNQCLILYPGRKSVNISETEKSGRDDLIQKDRKLNLIVIDGTWSTAKKTMNQSQNLMQLPRLCFTPPRPSAFRVRKQPREECFSTIEAIHHTIELLGDSCGFDTSARQHDGLLDVFDRMVDVQVNLRRSADPNKRRRSKPRNAAARSQVLAQTEQTIC